MIRSQEIPAGVRVRVFRRRFSSLPLSIEVIAAPLASASAVTGTVERIGSRWVLGRTHATKPLLPQVTVSKGFWDTFFDVYVTPDTPVIVRVESPSMRSRLLVWGLAAIVVVAASIIAALTVLR